MASDRRLRRPGWGSSRATHSPRRTSPSGKDTVDHGRVGHDDVANAVAGALVLAAMGSVRPTFATDTEEIVWEESQRLFGALEEYQDEDIVRLTAAARARGVTQARIDELVSHRLRGRSA